MKRHILVCKESADSPVTAQRAARQMSREAFSRDAEGTSVTNGAASRLAGAAPGGEEYALARRTGNHTVGAKTRQSEGRERVAGVQ